MASEDGRASAVYLLDQVLGEQRLMSELLGAGALERLSPAERARAQRLATETLRWLERADRILGRHLRKPPPLHVRNILRLGAVELCQGQAAHGVVDSLVGLTSRHKRHGPLKGLVNAVLRKVAANGPEEWQNLRMPRLPKWLRVPLVEAWGAEAIKETESAHAQGAPLDLTLKAPNPDLAAQLQADVLPTGSLRLRNPGQVSQLAGYDAGSWWVQDAAAALPALALAAKPGERVLDLCAAPGGKTLQLAATGADVTAVDISKRRMARVQENLTRCGLKADLQVADALAVTGQWDAVLLDAPCSATGTIRRHPDLPHAKDGQEFAALIDLQSTMIDHAWSLTRPGGRLVFCTCSLLPDEGEVQIEEALERHKDMRADARAFDLPGVPQDWIDATGLRTRPDFWHGAGGLDGFYMAVLHKIA